jgi:hypothetical protein
MKPQSHRNGTGQNIHFSSKTDEWPTPQWLFDALAKEFGFDLAPCATHVPVPSAVVIFPPPSFRLKPSGLRQAGKPAAAR